MKTLKLTRLNPILVTAALVSFCFSAEALTWRSTAGDLQWTNALNWSPNAAPQITDAVLFDNVSGFTNGSGVVNSVVRTNISIGTLTITAISNNCNTILIQTNQTLSIASAAGTLLMLDTGADNGADTQINTTMTGGGNLVIGNVSSPVTTTIIQIGQRSATGGAHRGTLDLSGLDSFSAGVGFFYLGGNGVSPLNRDQGTLILAKTNVIRAAGSATAGTFRLAHSPGNQGSGSFLFLGQENSIYADTIRLGGSRGGPPGGVVQFRTGLVGVPRLKLRAADTVSRIPTFALGDNSDGAGTTSSFGTLDTTGGTVDALIVNLFVGRTSTGTATGTGNGTVTFDAGTIDATTLSLGGQTGADIASQGVGTINVRGTAALVAGTLNIGRDAGATAGSGTGLLNVESGTVLVTGNVVENNGANGNGSSSIKQTGGNMTVNGNTTIDTLYLGTSQFKSGGFIGVGTLVLSNTAITLTLNSSINDTNPVCSVSNNFTTVTTATLNVVGGGFSIGQYPLIRYYAGTINGDGYPAIALGSLPPRTQGYLSNNVAANSIDLVVTNLSAAKWNGNIVGGDWDINNTANWLDFQTSTATIYLQAGVPGDSVIFDDTAAGTTTVNLTTNLSPAIVAMTNSSKLYVFSGPGALSGPGVISKNGNGTWVLTNTGLNDISGAISINDGTVQLGFSANRLPTNANVTLADVSTASINLGSQDQVLRSISGGGPTGGNVVLGAGNLTTTASGTYSGSISGNGMFRKVGTGTQTLGGASTYIGGTYINGGAVTLINTNGSGLGTGPIEIVTGSTLNVGNGADGGSIATVDITDGGTLALNSPINFSINSIFGGAGTVTKSHSNTVTIAGPGTYSGATTISDGALRISNATALGTTATTTISATAGAHLELLGNISVAENFTIGQKPAAAGQAPHFVNLSGTNTLTGTFTGNGGGSYWSYRSDAGKLIVTGTFNVTPTGTRTLRLFGLAEGDWATPYPTGSATTARILKEDSGTWTLSAINTYNGDTFAYGGKLVVNGQIQSLGTVWVGDDTAPTTPAMLSGSGTIAGSVFVSTNGMLSPANSIGTLTINNTLTMVPGSTNVFDVDTDTLAHDLVTGMTSVTYGGTLVILSSGLGTAVTNGASAQLFSAGSYSGSFNAIVPPNPGPGLYWNTSQLTVNGVLAITNVSPTLPPESMSFANAGGQVTISWPTIGWRLETQTNAPGIGITTNWFTVPGSTATNQMVMPVDFNFGSVFFRLASPRPTALPLDSTAGRSHSIACR